jgi:2-deoxy-D-gluconate 3-dehydrogenase
MTSVLDLFSLQGRTALVTGGTRGIGQSLAIALAEAGADVVLVQRNHENQATKQAIEKIGRKASIYTADLASASDVGGLTQLVLADGHDIDILVNCGGIQ